MKLNQWQREILKLEQQSDKDLNRKLYNAYNDSLKDVRKRLKTYMDEYEDLPYYKQQQAGKLSALEKEIVELLNGAYPKAKHEVTEFKRNELTDGYYSSMYQIESETGARLDFLGLDTEFVRQTVANPIAGKTLSKRLYTSRTKLANRATSELRIGMMQGKTYAEISGTISRHTEANYKQAVRIARTEGGRLRSLSKQVAYDEAKEMGIDLQKRWYSSLDNRTRSSHRELDGQTVEIDEKFKYGGHEADGPRLFGKANLDINCRCTTITIVDGIEPGTRLAKSEKLVNGKVINEYGSIPYKNYDEWKDKRISVDKPKDIATLMSEINMTTATKDDIIGLGSLVNQKHDIISILGDKQKLKEVLGKYRPIGGTIDKSTWVKGSKRSAKNRLSEVFEYYPTKWTEMVNDYKHGLYVGENKRGFFTEMPVTASLRYRDDKGMTIFLSDSYTVKWHEVGHMMEFLDPNIVRLEKEFLEYRTKGESNAKLADLFKGWGYKQDEVTKVDNFASPYMGKQYENNTEILSMGLEGIFQPDSNGFINSADGRHRVYKKLSDDQEYIDFVIGILLKGGE